MAEWWEEIIFTPKAGGPFGERKEHIKNLPKTSVLWAVARLLDEETKWEQLEEPSDSRKSWTKEMNSLIAGVDHDTVTQLIKVLVNKVPHLYQSSGGRYPSDSIRYTGDDKKLEARLSRKLVMVLPENKEQTIKEGLQIKNMHSLRNGGVMVEAADEQTLRKIQTVSKIRSLGLKLEEPRRRR
ncbi:hypothetical protein PR048_027007 [Dryococelus australis]|uniref:Gag protein n=1 Tax=Dryococelus australis TaxID=614101 RepID=A0ABQ9GMX6_9NEOP|nr:hypothetical protein PR048_027007 [Dryococelus australis]